MTQQYLYDLQDNLIRPATDEEARASYNTPDHSGIITVDGQKCYADDMWEDEWRAEYAREQGMLVGSCAYNDFMGY
jgi:hypothetical protein